MDELFVDDTTPHASARDRKIVSRRVVVDGRSTALLWRQGIEPAAESYFFPNSIFRPLPARAA